MFTIIKKEYKTMKERVNILLLNIKNIILQQDNNNNNKKFLDLIENLIRVFLNLKKENINLSNNKIAMENNHQNME